MLARHASSNPAGSNRGIECGAGQGQGQGQGYQGPLSLSLSRTRALYLARDMGYEACVFAGDERMRAKLRYYNANEHGMLRALLRARLRRQ